MTDYTSYTNYVESICQINNIDNFKNNQIYRSILEHVSEQQGHEYLYFIKNTINITDNHIKEFCMLNDSIGNPNKCDYKLIVTSPSNLRYILQANIILKHIQKLELSLIDIVEVGGGYGGLCLAIHYFSKIYNLKINSYTIIDLASISKLQSLYLKTVDPTLDITFIDAATFGESISKKNLFLVSNYCFSEISNEFQKKYIDILFPKVSHGFIAWNAIPVYNFGFDLTDEIEYPKTGEYNRYIYF